MVDVRDPATVTVTVYHHCPTGASGSALGPYDRLAYWWADQHGIRLAAANGDRGTRADVLDAIAEAIGGDPSDRIRAAQDAAAEAID